jgi:hypothetical protein
VTEKNRSTTRRYDRNLKAYPSPHIASHWQNPTLINSLRLVSRQSLLIHVAMCGRFLIKFGKP